MSEKLTDTHNFRFYTIVEIIEKIPSCRHFYLSIKTMVYVSVVLIIIAGFSTIIKGKVGASRKNRKTKSLFLLRRVAVHDCSTLSLSLSLSLSLAR